MIDLYCVATNMTNKYVPAGLKVAQELGDVTVTVRKPSRYWAEKAVLFNRDNNLCVLETEQISVEEREQCLRVSTAEAKND